MTVRSAVQARVGPLLVLRRTVGSFPSHSAWADSTARELAETKVGAKGNSKVKEAKKKMLAGAQFNVLVAK